MKKVTLVSNLQLQIVEAPEPMVEHPDDIKIKVSYSAVCTNDLMVWNGSLSNPYRDNGIGHEFSGIVVDLGPAAAQAGFTIGDRVSGFAWNFCGKCPNCRAGRENLCLNLNASGFVGTMAEYIVIKDRMTCRLPDNVSLQEGCLTEVVSACMHAIDRLQLSIGDSVLLLGGGVSGQIMTKLAKMSGASNVTVYDKRSSKRVLAQEMGADHVIDAEHESLYEQVSLLTEDFGFDAIVNIIHEPEIVSELSGLIARGGKILIFTQYKPTETGRIHLSELYVKEATIMTAYLSPYQMDRAMKILHMLNLNRLIGKEYTLDQVQDAFEEYAKGIYPRIILRHTDKAEG